MTLTQHQQEVAAGGLIEDPYGFYQQLQDRPPVHFSEAFGAWMLGGYSDVSSALRDPRLSLGGGARFMFERLESEERQALAPLERHVSLWMGTLDPPQHTRIRSLMQRAFSGELVEAMRHFTGQVVHQLIDAQIEAGRMDIVSDLAYPLPARVIAKVLGTPVGDAPRFLEWSQVLTEFIAYGLMRTDVLFRAQETVGEMTEYFLGLLDGAEGSEGLLGNLIRLPEWQDAQVREQLLANCVLLLFAGHETTTILIGNSVLALIQHPRQLEELRQEPGLMRSAVQECLRFDSPIQMVRRLAVDDLEFGDRQISQGEFVWLCLGAANRDPARFAQPHRLDVRRAKSRHLAFGSGIHYCLGAALSSLEAEVALAAVLERLDGLRLDPERLDGARLQWQDNPTARSLQSLPVAFAAECPTRGEAS
ncbi:MAG TPA: cytochrome P450 [Acidobacteriota bacterium]|nr:cytochrome P450 [Acidobacteriota bacterium]